MNIKDKTGMINTEYNVVLDTNNIDVVFNNKTAEEWKTIVIKYLDNNDLYIPNLIKIYIDKNDNLKIELYLLALDAEEPYLLYETYTVDNNTLTIIDKNNKKIDFYNK